VQRHVGALFVQLEYPEGVGGKPYHYGHRLGRCRKHSQGVAGHSYEIIGRPRGDPLAHMHGGS
jgi:hypothetical protein